MWYCVSKSAAIADDEFWFSTGDEIDPADGWYRVSDTETIDKLNSYVFDRLVKYRISLDMASHRREPVTLPREYTVTRRELTDWLSSRAE